MDFFIRILRSHPELAVFLTLATGFIIGRIKVGSFTVGPMLGCLFAGMIIGIAGIHVAPVVKVIFFDLFLFATGYKVGPQFFYGLKKEALPQLVLTLVVCIACLFAAYGIARTVGYDVGTTAGLLAGAFTESTVIGTAGDAIQQLSLPDDEKQRLVNNIPVAYAVTYIFGTSMLVWFLPTIAPKLLRINLKTAAKELEKKYDDQKETMSAINSAFREWTLRAFRLSSGPWVGATVAGIENSIPGGRIIVERIRQKGIIMEPLPGMIIGQGDTIVVAARQNIMLEKLDKVGEEVVDRELMDFPVMNMDMTVSKKTVAGRSLRDLAMEYGQGVMLNKLRRGGQEMPFEPGTIVQKGDVLSVFGRQTDVEHLAAWVGFREVNKLNTDIAFVAAGIILGGLVGLLSWRVAGIEITLSTSGGALLMGLVFGWLHSRLPSIGRIPEAALWVFDSMGLAAFLAVVGLAAGPTFIQGLGKTGWSIVLIGIFLPVLPHVLGLIVGRYALKMNPVILLGALAGAGTNTTALKAVQDAAGSKLPVLGYTIPYALGNIILTAWGPIIVSMMTR